MMEFQFKDWVGAIIASGALVLSIMALVQSAKTEKLSKRIGFFAEKLSSLRSMVEQIEQIKFDNLASPNDDINKTKLTVASKAQRYEHIFRTYPDCLDTADAARLSGIIQESRNQSQVSIDAAQAGNRNANAEEKYFQSMAYFINEMETLPQQELEKISKEREMLSP